MGFLDILGLVSSTKGSKEIRRRMLTGRDISTGYSNYSKDVQKRIGNLEKGSTFERVEVEPTENSQTVLYKIEELERKLKKGCISEYEKITIEERINVLRGKYEELLNKEVSNRTSNEKLR